MLVTIPRRWDRGLFVVAVAGFVTLTPSHTEAQEARGSVRADSMRQESVAPLGIRLLAAERATPGLLGRVDTTNAPLLGSGEPLDAIAGQIAGVRVYRPSSEPGMAPLVALHGRTTIDRSPAPLYVLDGVPLVGSPIDVAAPGLREIEVLSGQLAASWLGSTAHDGLIHLRTGAIALPPAGFAARLRSDVGTSWNPGHVARNRHHDFLVNEAGEYVDEQGNVVGREERVRDPAGISATPYAGGTYDPVGAIFTSGLRQSFSGDVAGSLPRSQLWASVGHDRDAGVILESEGYRRTHLHLRSEHALHDQLRIGLTGYTARSRRDDAHFPRTLTSAQLYPVDIDLRARTATGEYVDQVSGVPVFNPLWLLASSSSVVEGERLVLGARAAWTPLPWLTVDAGLGRDRLERSSDYALPSAELTRTEFSLASRTSSALAVTARDLWGPVASSLTLAWTRSTLRDSLYQREELDPGCLPGFDPCVPTGTATNAFWGRAPQQTIAAHAQGSLDERLTLDLSVRREENERFPVPDRWTTHYRVAARAVVSAYHWWPSGMPDRLAVSGSWGTSTGFLSSAEARAGLLDPPQLGWRFVWRAEREREAVASLELRAAQRVGLRLGYDWVKTDHAAIGGGGGWATDATLNRHGLEASLAVELVRRPTSSWMVALTADRHELTISDMNMPCMVASPGLRCPGEPLDRFWAARLIRSHGDLPGVHAGSPGAFAVNDDGLLVPIGSGGSLATPQWGTTVSIDGIDYAWGLPLYTMSPDNSIVVHSPYGDPTNTGVGVTSVFRWRAMTLAAIVSGQFGGDLWDRDAQFSILTRLNPILDQSGKPEAERKPFAYYNRLREASPSDFFMRDASHLVLQELSARWRFGSRWLGGARTGGERFELAVVGRNLAAWSRRDGLFTELRSPMAAVDDARYPRPRTLSVRLGADF